MDDDIRRALQENLRLNKENNRLLRKMRRAASLGLFFQVAWIAILIGVPVALYFYVLEPYYEGLRAGYEQFEAQIKSTPGLNLLFKGEAVPPPTSSQ